jgi:hypothetical protein
MMMVAAPMLLLYWTGYLVAKSNDRMMTSGLIVLCTGAGMTIASGLYGISGLNLNVEDFNHFGVTYRAGLLLGLLVYILGMTLMGYAIKDRIITWYSGKKMIEDTPPKRTYRNIFNEDEGEEEEPEIRSMVEKAESMAQKRTKRAARKKTPPKKRAAPKTSTAREPVEKAPDTHMDDWMKRQFGATRQDVATRAKPEPRKISHDKRRVVIKRGA